MSTYDKEAEHNAAMRLLNQLYETNAALDGFRDERLRQIYDLGYTPTRDDHYEEGQLADMAIDYLKAEVPNRVKNLLAAGALIVAELERLGRVSEAFHDMHEVADDSVGAAYENMEGVVSVQERDDAFVERAQMRARDEHERIVEELSRLSTTAPRVFPPCDTEERTAPTEWDGEQGHDAGLDLFWDGMD
jgi:hypothetical protein